MKKIKLSAVLLLIAAVSSVAQTNWKVDASHSKLGFSVTHMMISETEGKFKLYEGKIAAKTDADFTDATIEFSVDVNSINTDDDKRDGHLKSDDFFNVEKFPKITFKSTSVKKGKVKNQYIVIGDLTIRDVTKKVTFIATHTGKNVKDPWGMTRTAFAVTGLINRMEYGLKWNAALETGGVAVSELVKINCVLELIKG